MIYAGYKNGEGYGQKTIRLDGKQHNFKVHRLMYESILGVIPDGLVLDHLCKTTSCINPEHLEPVSVKENVRRGKLVTKYCSKGHEYTPDSTHYTPHKNGYMTKKCRECFKRIYR